MILNSYIEGTSKNTLIEISEMKCRENYFFLKKYLIVESSFVPSKNFNRINYIEWFFSFKGIIFPTMCRFLADNVR